MTPLAKKTLAVAMIGLCTIGSLSFTRKAVGGLSTENARYEAAMIQLGAECHTYRSAPNHEHAEVCRDWDMYGPHATAMVTKIERRLDEAKAAAERGDWRAAEVGLHTALASSLPELDGIGSFIAAGVGSSSVRKALDILDAHPSLDRAYVLRDIHFELFRHPFTGDSLERRWRLNHNRAEANMSKNEVVDALEADASRDRVMEEAALRFDEGACSLAAGEQMTAYCPRLVAIARTGARLDAMRR